MDKMNYAPIKGKFRPLNFSINVMFDAADKFGSMSKAFSIIDKENREGAEAICWFLVQMANDAELVRRQEGQDHGDMLSDSDVVIDNPAIYRVYKSAVLKAIEIGYTCEIENDNEVDLGLQELNQKKEKAGA